MCSPAWRAMRDPNVLRRSSMTAPSIFAVARSAATQDSALSLPARNRPRQHCLLLSHVHFAGIASDSTRPVSATQSFHRRANHNHFARTSNL